MEKGTLKLSNVNFTSQDLENDGLIIRRAQADDPFKRIAAILYDTDPYIFPYWFNNHKEEGISILAKLIADTGSYFNYHHIWVAEYQGTIRAILVAFDKHSEFNYDYTALKAINHAYDFTVRRLIENSIKAIHNLPRKMIFGAYLGVDREMRRQKIGSRLYGKFLYHQEQAGFKCCYHYCLNENTNALSMYQQLGFQSIGQIDAFQGDTTGSSVSPTYATALTRKHTNPLPEICKF